jgi:hypothetical protein
VAYRGTKAAKALALGAIGWALVLACVSSAKAQVTVGDKFKMLMNGNVGAVYSGNYGDYVGSNHSLGLGFNGTLEGYYFDPQFLSFQVHPYYDRAQSNAESQAVTRGTGVESSASVFSGSHFPGSISYGKDFSSNSEFGIAGAPSVLGNSSGSNFNVAWSALVEGLPSLHASYSMSDSTSTLLGTSNQGRSSSKSFDLNSSYTLAGFNLQGRFGHYNTDFLSPSFLTGTTISGTSSNTNYGIVATRSLPLSGSLGLGLSRTTSQSGTESLAGNSYTASASISPWRRLSLSGTFNYLTNAFAELSQLFDANNLPLLVKRDSNSNAIYMNTTATFTVGHGITVAGYLNHRMQHYQEEDLSNSQYGGTLNFQKANSLFGFMRFSIGVVDSATQDGNGSLGLVTNVSLSRKFGQWETSGDFSYFQNTRTLFGVVTTSNYTYGGMLRRKIDSSTHWSASFRESRSGLAAQDGDNNVSDSIITNFSWNKYSISGSYSRSNGEALLSANGTLTPTPIGSLLSDYFLTFNARSYGLTASTQLFRVLTLSGNYTNVSGNSVQKSLNTFNNGDRYSARIALRMRRLYLIAGFDHAVQTASAVPGGPRSVNSYYVSLSRWFNIF